MAGAGGQDRDVAGGDFEFLALIATEPNAGVPTRNPERFVNGRVIMQIVVNAVAPHVAPAIGAEQLFDRPFRMIVGHIDRALVDHKRQRIVGNEAVVGKHEGEGFEIGVRKYHGHSCLLIAV
jgi:hypothetical protein